MKEKFRQRSNCFDLVSLRSLGSQRILCIIAGNLKIYQLFITWEDTSDSTVWFIKNVSVSRHYQAILDLDLGISALDNGEPVKIGKPSSYMVRSVFKKVIQEAP